MAAEPDMPGPRGACARRLQLQGQPQIGGNPAAFPWEPFRAPARISEIRISLGQNISLFEYFRQAKCMSSDVRLCPERASPPDCSHPGSVFRGLSPVIGCGG